MIPYIGKIRITCDGKGHIGKNSRNTGAECINCPGSVVEVLDLENNVIATQSAGEDSGDKLEE